MKYEIKCGDVLEQLATMTDGSVQCCVTSPPYWGLRDYGTARWEGGDAACDHKRNTIPKDDAAAGRRNSTLGGSKEFTTAAADGALAYRDKCGKCGAIRIDRQIGLESTPDAYVEKMVAVFREVRRCLRDDGTLWLNLGDSYAANRGCQVPDSKHIDVGNAMASSVPAGLKPKDLCMIPWRVALALQADGWWLRSVIVWAKKSPMPESVTDRPTSSWEPIFLLAKNARYYYDAEAVKEPNAVEPHAPKNRAGTDGGHLRNDFGTESMNRVWGVGGRNQRNVWHLGPEPYAEAHFATFPTEIPRRAIMAGSRPGDMILDPFNGSGTTGAVALQHDRRYIGIELNPEYVRLAHDRIGKAVRPATYQSTKQADAPLFTMEADR